MAATAAGALLTQQHRLAQVALRAVLIRDLALLWPLFEVSEFASFDQFLLAAELLVQARYGDSVGLAAGYLRLFRSVEGVPGPLDVATPPPLPSGVIRDSLRGSGLLGTLDARRAGMSPQAATRNGFVRVAGASTSLVLAGGRQTILESIGREPSQPHWQRITSGRPCAFCAMLASRGPAYRSQDSAGFQAHDHCSCTPEPAYSGSRMPETSQVFRDQWREVTHGLSGTDALNAFRSSLEVREEPAAPAVAA